MFGIHRKAGPGRHRVPDPSEFAKWGSPLRAQQPAVGVRPNPDLASAAETTMPLPLPIPGRARVERALVGMRMPTAPQPAEHEGLAPVPQPHLPQLEVVDRTAHTVTFAVTTAKPAPQLPAFTPAGAPLPKRTRRHVPQALALRERPLTPYDRMMRDLTRAHGQAMQASAGAARMWAEFDEHAAKAQLLMSAWDGRATATWEHLGTARPAEFATAGAR